MNERESGAHALRDLNGWGRNGDGYSAPRGVPMDMNSPSGTPFSDNYGYDHNMPPHPVHSQPSYGSHAQLAAGAVPPSGMTPYSGSERSLPLDGGRPSPPQAAYPYNDSPYNRYSSSNLQLAPQMGAIDPQTVDDDDDWGMGPQANVQQKRRSFVPFGGSRNSREGTPSSGAGSAGAATLVGAGAATSAYAAAREKNGPYDAVPGGSSTGVSADIARAKAEKLDAQKSRKKRILWIVAIVILLIIIGAILGGILGTVLKKENTGRGSGSSSGETQQTVEEDNKNELNIKSSEIQKLMNNPNLHKVFPGIDYTPLNAQYPDCMHVPPSQNNITRDLAVMSQLTNAVRLYGTDCNQTEMVLTAIDRLQLKDMKLWLGVWLGNNATTNQRQVDQMWDIIDKFDVDKMKGVIVGNEVLYRKDLTETQLMKFITDIKTNMTTHSRKHLSLPIATSDLGDNWTAEMARQVDAVMSNVHPFFAGVEASKGAGWTWDFWTNHDVVLTKNYPNISQVVAEVGWPSAGGNNCGGSTCTSSTQGSVAGITEMNTFMESWICPSLKNGTNFFWFSAFDEPWKIRYNEKGKEWEDKWGLMDVNRKLKPGITIPDCGGQRAS